MFNLKKDDKEILVKEKFTKKDLLYHLFFSVVIFIAMVIISPDKSDLGFSLIINPIKIILNILPVFLSGILLQAIIGRFKLSIMINSIFYLVIYIVNRTKIIYRSSPIKLSDFRLGIEAATMVKNSYFPDLMGILMLIVFVGIIIFSLTKIDNFKFNKKKRFQMGIAVLLIAPILYTTVYSKSNIYNSLKSNGNEFNIIDHFNSKGFNYSFIHNIKRSFVRKPEGFDEKEMKRRESVNRGEDISVIKYNERPNIIWIMGEAFTDISENKNFSFAPENDPLTNYKRILNEAVFNGRIVTPSFGGGTGDTEFDVLTGCLTTDTAPDENTSFSAVKRNTGSLASTLSKVGYKTSAFHPGFAWFYGREEVYPKLGFQERLFFEDIKNPEMKGGYVSERQFSEIYRNRFLENIKSDEPVFEYAVDIQNHGPYYYDKYEGDMHTLPYESNMILSEDAANNFGVYFLGIKDMDKMLGEVYDMINSIEEPTIMVFYGDHLPYLGNDPSGFDEIGMNLSNENLEKEIQYYSTPFIIAANARGREFLNPSNVEVERGGIISANYLSSLFLDMLNYNKIDNFFMYNSDLRKKLPIISRNYIFDGNEAHLRNNIPENIKEIYDDYRKYEYYRINY
ncbi:LTA synthase family protein [Peptoniphilus sp. MSJ-1]|uniref:LTA synthase family protein n=1 Tax=Peptoniphilus ovalis TaxID=2841503 RepID=A0ABS6FK34_9FIRM|nr:LTA synthase family protein [Peptoniphilus ovalis]MBU5669872.1 LTA synthase family protein [Peptoniphilus ovalis]